jgi:hypothetical protein
MNEPAENRASTIDDAESSNQNDPLDIEQANSTRKMMSQGRNINLVELFSTGQNLYEKFTVLMRYLKCRYGPGELTVEEFLNFRLNRPETSDACRFVGHTAQHKMHKACNDASWFATTKNKLLWETILTGAGLRVPKTLAVYEKLGRGGGVPILQNKAALADFLSQPSNIPVFCKPVTGVYSIGAFRIDAFDGKSAVINDQWEKPIDEIALYFETIGKKGYLLQRPLSPHKKLLSITGNSISTLRFILRMDGGTPCLMRCVLKVPAKGEVADNFWRPQAQLCAVEIESGKITAIITNEDGNHFSTATGNMDGCLVTGFEIPDFQATIKLLTAAARHFPAIRTQSWDVAVTNDGPVLMELNFGGDLGLVQLAHGSGILTGEYCDHLRKSGYKGQLPD